MTPSSARPEALTIPEAAAELGIGVSRVYQLIDEGRLKRAGEGLSTASVEDYNANRRAPGRPRRTK